VDHPSEVETIGNGASGSGGKGNCYRCGKRGHWAQDCWRKQPKKDKDEQAFTAQEEESTLLYAKIESEVSPAMRRSGGGMQISDGDAGCGTPDQWIVCASAGTFGPTGAHVPKEEGVAAQLQSAISKPDGARKEVHIVEEKVFAALGEY
jgi:hypothetical protein